MVIRFGDYVLHKQIGRGGMAEVWAARRLTASGAKACAVKRIHLTQAADAEHRDLFLKEGALAMMLRHGNLVPVFNVGEQDGMLYMEMELVDGVPLDRFVKHVRRRHERGPKLEEMVHIVSEVLRALHYVHTFTVGEVNQHIVHRDVSPQNILVTSNGEIRLTDFGVARMVDGRTTGRIYGKLNYMPREQFEGNPLPASDLFALGAVFFELVSGRRFRAGCATEREHQDAIMSGVSPVLGRELPTVLEETLAWLLHPDPVERAPSAKAVLNVLGTWEGMRNMQLDLEELYLDCVDSRHSWYTTVTEKAEDEPAVEGAPRAASVEEAVEALAEARPATTAPGRLREIPRPKDEDDEEPTILFPDRGAPLPGREREPAQPHVAAQCVDDTTTARWRRPGEDVAEVALP